MKRRPFPRKLEECVDAAVNPTLGARGKMQARLLKDWPAIAGEEIAANSRPESLIFPQQRLSEGTLCLKVSPSFALTLQYKEPQLLEKLAVYFGYRAIARIRLVQAPLERKTAPVIPPERLARAEQLRALAESLQTET